MVYAGLNGLIALIRVIRIVTLLITPLIITHEPPSRLLTTPGLEI